MLSYDLVRMGRIIRNSSIQPADILKLVSDIGNNMARNFLSKVVIVEIDKRNKNVTNIAVLPLRECGNWVAGSRKKAVFEPDVNQALPFPFVIPSGGNPLHPQGIYPVPVYPVYERHFKGFLEDEASITEFLLSRLNRTIDINLSHDEVSEIAYNIHKKLYGAKFTGKMLGLMVLAVITESSPYYLTISLEANSTDLVLGKSYIYPGKTIAASTKKILNNFWLAKFAEGEAGGQKEKGVCTICQKEQLVVSAYNKALYWLPTTWGAPLPFGNDKSLVDSIALCIDCYSNLTLGASLFGKLSNEVDRALTKEVFAPAGSPVGKKYALQGSVRDIIRGSMVVLPLDDYIFEDHELADEWVYATYNLMGEGLPEGLSKKKATGRTKHLKNITGFETSLPEEWDNEEFRLSLIYFTGDPGKLNIHLRSVINDILPTTASKLDKLCRQVVEEMEEIIYDQTRLSEKSAARKTRQIGNLFYLLVTAFGPSYLWSSLEKAFKKQPLAKRLFYKNCSARMTQLAKMLPESMFTLQQEAVDYFAINRFLDNYSIELVNTGDCQINSPKNPEGGDLIMKPVQELISLTWETLAEDIKFENIDELGFAAGQVVQRFGNSYYAGTNGKDYIKHRIMTFGTSLTPEVIHLKALGRMEEYTSMLDLKVSLDVLKRAAVITMGFVQYEGEIKTNKDRFMAAFWAGYSLGRKKKASELKENQESDN